MIKLTSLFSLLSVLFPTKTKNTGTESSVSELLDFNLEFAKNLSLQKSIRLKDSKLFTS